MFLAYLLINLVNFRLFVTFSCSFQKKIIIFAATREKMGSF